MANIETQLSSELTRIIDCPYPASLSHLADLLARADVLTVRASIHDRPPCAVSRLATLVCEALSQWAYALHVLASLCQSPEFSDTILLQNHGLLNALLIKSNSTPRGFDDYAGLCVRLLSRPLPASVPLPASAQLFFIRIFEKASRTPDVSTLKPVYSMLNGACRDLLSVLPTKDRQQFDQELSHILSRKTTGQDSMLLLWCFGIVLLAEHAREAVRLQDSHMSFEECPATAPVETQWKTESGRRLFGSTTSLYKTINLAYLSVIWATKGDVGISDEEAVEGIRIAVRTLQCVDRAILRTWPKSSPSARNTFVKLPVKLSRANIDPTIQFEALCFYAMIAGDENLALEVVTRYERRLTNLASLVNAECLGETLLIALPVYSPHIQQSTVQAILAGVLSACTSPPDSHHLLNYTTLVEQITTVLPNCASLQANILSAVLSDELQAEIWKVILGKVQKEHATCQAYAASLHQHLISATIALLLTLALALPTTGQTLPLGITTALVSKQRQLPHLIHQCNHEISDLEPPRVSLFQQKSTPHTGQHLQNWRGRLKSELESQGFYQRDIIMRSVAQICQDLEARCDTVEEPLRREREKSQELQQQVAELRERVASLEVQAADDRFHSEGLEDEKLIISDERDSLSAKLKQLEATTSEIIRKADNVLIKAHEDFNAKELELRSTIITYEESIRAHDKEIENQNGTLDRLREDLEHVQNQRTSLSEQHTILQHQLCNVEQKLNSERETVRTQSGQIAQLKTRNLELEHQVQGTETKLKATAVQLNDLLVNHRELIQSSDEAYRNLDHKYTRDMEAAAIKAKDDCETLDARLQEAIQHGQREKDAHDVTRRDLQLLQISIPPLQDKIDELTEFCTEQEEELEELRTLRKNVLASFGYASQNPLAIRSASRIHKGIVDSQTPGQPREHRRRKSAVQISNEAPTASRGTHGVTSTAMENIANASFASSDSHSSQNGSTPKRSKPRPSFKVPTMHTPHTHKPILASRSVSKKLSPIKRSALRQMSPNRRHTTVGFGVSENGEEHSNELRSIEKRRGSFREDQADHDMEEILVGTPLTPGNFTAGTGRVPENDEETVGEF